jgi:hypothetical protein
MSALELLESLRAPEAAAPDRRTEGEQVVLEVPMRFGATTLRLRRMAGRWLASAAGPDGELRLAGDTSPYLAASLALEPWQVDASHVMRVVAGALRS